MDRGRKLSAQNGPRQRGGLDGGRTSLARPAAVLCSPLCSIAVLYRSVHNILVVRPLRSVSSREKSQKSVEGPECERLLVADRVSVQQQHVLQVQPPDRYVSGRVVRGLAHLSDLQVRHEV